MSGAQSWNVKGIDPKVREAAREAAERQGMTVAEYLNFALANQAPHGGQPTAPRQRPLRTLSSARLEESEDGDWDLSTSSPPPRALDPARLAQRLEAIERRTQLAVTGLDRAVSTIDRSVLGLAARIEDAEAVSSESAERVAEALEHFRIAGDTLGGRLERAEEDSEQSRRALDTAKSDLLGVRARLENQVAIAEEVARRAEAAASFLTTEMETRSSAHARMLVEARKVAEEAAYQAAQASSDAVAELRLLQEQMSDRLAETETSTRRVIESAIQEVRAETASETRGAREALLEEVVRLESEIAKRVGAIEQLKSEQSTLIARIERAEAGARESTAGLRQAAGAAIADLRNAQLALAARVKQVEDSGAGGGGVDLTDVRQQQQDIAERLITLERKTEASPVTDALAAFETRLSQVEQTSSAESLADNEAVATLDQALRRLADRIAETESTANTAIRTLEETVSSLGARMEQKDAAQETEAVRAVLEERLSQMVGDARAELAGQLQAALEGSRGEGFDEALADVNQRLAAAERRQAQTIEAISLEIRRMSETVDKRLRTVEARNDDAAAAAVREELSRMATTLEQRFDEIETREAAAFDRMGLEVGRLSERLEERFGAVEKRSAQAIEHVGEQVARMAERFNQRQEALARDMGERMLDSEERAGARVTEAIGSIMQRLAEVEANSADAIAPVQKAVSSVASKLERYESERDLDTLEETLPTPARRADDLDLDDYLDTAPPYVSPMNAAQPLRAAPLTPHPHGLSTSTESASTSLHAEQDEECDDLDIYFSEEDKREHLQFDEPPPVEESSPPPLDFERDLDDLLVEDEPTPVSTVDSAPQEEPLWTQAADKEETSLGHTLDSDIGDEAPTLGEALAAHPSAPATIPATTTPVGRNDYLSVARRAAQAQSSPRTERAPSPRLSLRGSSRVILWGAATAVVALLAGGAWYLNAQQETPSTPRPSEAGVSPAAAARAAEAAAAQTPTTAAPAEGEQAGDAELADSHETVMAGPLAPSSASLEQAAQSGDLTAQYELALQRLSAGRTQEGVTLLRRAADRGFAMAQYRLAKLYERGEGVTADLAVARQWTERAAAAGNRRAMHDLGVYFARGEGAPLDEAAAFRWFRQAAELGVADSQYNLGVLYQQGRGVNASPSEALFWFLVASRQGDQDASARATALEAQLPQAQAQQARARAQAFRPRAASAAANGEFGQRAAAAPAR
jgi:localization factor PodJL